MKKWLLLSLSLLSLLSVSGCTSLPEGVKPVQNFELESYLGTWHEIARLDHSFERGLSQVTAEYQMRKDGGVSVTNRGFNQQENEWSEAVGKAYFVGEPNVGHLKVSFFGPFYASYVVFELGDDYAFISGYNKEYLWLLAREPQVSDALLQSFKEKALELGFDLSELVVMNQP